MATIWLGNRNAIEVIDTETGPERRALPGNRCTEVRPPDSTTVRELIHDLTHQQGIWAAHSDAPAPAWVASDDPDMATAIAAVYGCPIRDPEPEV